MAPTSPLELPDAWTAYSDASKLGDRTAATPLAAWWLRLGDPLLADLVNDALRANPSVRSAVAVLAQSRATADQQSASLHPRLGVSASAQRNRQGDAGVANTFRAGFDASWEPDLFGAGAAGAAAADAQAMASAASLGNVQVSVAAEVALNYLLLRGLQARLDIAQASRVSLEETLQLTQWRLQAGLLTALEVDQAQAATAQSRAQIVVLETAAAQAEHALAVLTGRAPVALRGRLASATASPEPSAAGGPLARVTKPALQEPSEALVLALPAETLRQRPDVRAAQALVLAAAQNVNEAQALRLPNFSLNGSLGSSALTVGTLSQGSSVLASLLASVAAPLADGGALRAQVRVQEAALLKAGADYDAAVLAALQEVEDALLALRNDRNRLRHLRQAANAATDAAQLASQRFNSGLIDFQVVLETQRTALSAQDAVASSLADLHADHVRLYKALGGGWAPSDMNPSSSTSKPADPAAAT
jgi:NodT family efflux transporter outer membrane factor (OMF) lipoprotein